MVRALDARVSAAVMAADQALQLRITELYRDGRNNFHARNYTEAEKELQDCLSLYQQSRQHLLEPEKLATIAKECERILQQTRELKKFRAVAGRWRQRLEVLSFSEFEIKEADLESTMEYFRKRAGEAFAGQPPNFLFRISPEKLQSKFTLQLRDVTALQVLNAIESQMRIEAKFEEHAIIFEDLVEVEK